jgi:hypothetical protein
MDVNHAGSGEVVYNKCTIAAFDGMVMPVTNSLRFEGGHAGFCSCNGAGYFEI